MIKVLCTKRTNLHTKFAEKSHALDSHLAGKSRRTLGLFLFPWNPNRHGTRSQPGRRPATSLNASWHGRGLALPATCWLWPAAVECLLRTDTGCAWLSQQADRCRPEPAHRKSASWRPHGVRLSSICDPPPTGPEHPHETDCSRSGSAGERQPEPKPVARSSTRRLTAAPP